MVCATSSPAATQIINDMSHIQPFHILEPTFPTYPGKLRSLFGELASPEIWYTGNLQLLSRKSVGFCGARSASEQGVRVAEDCGEQLVAAGGVVVSGYAKGVDTAAHLAALRNGGETIVVLPEGSDHFRLRQDMKDFWDWKRVLVISQFGRNAVWRPDRAMERNKVIVSLSDATIVIEAGEVGGTFHAGMTALKLKKPLFVVNYSSPSDAARGNALLLSSGGSPLNRSKKTGKAELGPVYAAIGLTN